MFFYNMRFRTLVTAVLLPLMICGTAQAARNYISIVGSSTVYTFATVVAERFGKTSGFKTPKIESTGSGGGFKLFCGGIGVRFPDITNASRAIKNSEIKRCIANGVTDIVEVKIGYDGIVLARSKSAVPLKLTLRDIFLALAREVPDPANAERLIPNPYTTWKEINASLPASKIEVLGPPPTSGTRDAFVELAMEGGARSFAFLRALQQKDTNTYKAICHTIREDGVYVEAGENDNLIVQKLQANPNAVGILGFAFLEQNSDTIQGSWIEGTPASFEAIADGRYPLSRPLFFYIKKAHVAVIPGMKEYLTEFTSKKTWGEEGYLRDKGMIPLPEAERKRYKDAVSSLTTLDGI